VLNERGELIGIHGRAVEPKVEPSEINPSIAVLKTSYNLGVPINAQAYYYRGLYRAKLNDKAGALADYQKAATLSQEQKNTTLYNNILKEIQILEVRE
jgi:tetratricopeptide (TPR) repeat protein